MCDIVGIRIRNGRQSDPIMRVPNMDGFEPNAQAGLTTAYNFVQGITLTGDALL